MVEERVTDGVRIAELLASEVTGRADGPLAGLAVTDADPDVEPTTDGALAYVVERSGPEPADGSGVALAEVYVHPDRVRVEFVEGVEAAVEAAGGADRADLRVRPKAVRPPRALVLVESGAAVKVAVDVLAAAADAVG